MKTRFNTYDIVCSITELQKLIGMRVNNIYDIDNKTYLIRLQRTEEKAVLLLESGNRFHVTGFEWPKNVAPSGFSMKMRKHLKNKRLENLRQLGTDRIVDMQFGTNEAAYHVILELYDRGNIILTDFEMTILYVLRPHSEGEELRFVVKEKYPVDRARVKQLPELDEIKSVLANGKPGDQLRKVLIPHLDYGPALIEHVLLEHGFNSNAKIGKGFDSITDLDQLMAALRLAEDLMQNARSNPSKGFIIQKKEVRRTTDTSELNDEFYYSKQEFHPFLFKQNEAQPHQEYETYNQAVDEFFSSLESQKLDMKAIHQEREAFKKLDNVKKDHNQRLQELEKTQEVDKLKAELITRNQTLVDQAILAVQSALASQMSWPDIQVYVSEAQLQGDPIAGSIKKLKLDSNHMTLHLSDPYDSDSSDNSTEDTSVKLKPMMIDIDLALSAFANARRFYDLKRTAAKKQQRTLDAQGKALKSAEKKTKQTLKDVQTITSINKARKVYWFEKFFWFISSENYLVIGGRDQQQNEMIVKRYMKGNDVYVHADVHGAASVVVKNTTDQPVPPKTLNEAGTMAICYSVAWEAKVVTSAWWVNASQVSKTAPTGEYLTTGSFMVRGKKNYLPPCHLIMGLSFLFKLEDGSVERHKDERRIRAADDDLLLVTKLDEPEQLEVIDESPDDDEEPAKEEEEEEEEENNVSSTETSSEDGDSKYPDTHIKIQHFQGTKMNLLAEPITPLLADEIDSDSEKVVFLGDDKPVFLKTSGGRSRGPSESKNKPPKDEKEALPIKKNEDKQQVQVKRGQKGKLKKIKEKYKDQDDEERKLRMNILQTSSKPKDSKKSKKLLIAQQPKKPVVKPRPQPVTTATANDPDEEDEQTQVQAEVDMIDSLTGVPTSEDELLFAVTVVAPYNTLTGYKYKVKLTPGTGKRGKAARTALAMFLRDRTATQREKDLLRSVKDENLARNLPGKVKVSAPKMQNAYKK